MWAIIKIIIGLFIWLALPSLIFKKKSKKRSVYKRFVSIVCIVVGALIVILGVIDIIKYLYHILLS
ncbi:hypothetical protein Palpr_2040 [Paludibacter propionicigenes WB4]|uniref:Uncharacterized protein n=1 Tax=Paludibacter propionicigenes (strain DSM 17365 / JCM 13257 / WB4) TaxID=694427 RepID=E4T633_PALPW|nr:hypothetical protein Palpr_2040 [Paludibacter propionicigenes WB4]